MPILQSNIKFVESQVMDDVPEGGGVATGIQIVDGEMNNVFPDISDLDRAYGRFNLRKIFVAILTLDTDLFGGAKTAITQLPIDPAIGYAVFSTGTPFDDRTAAINFVESYLYKGTTWPGHLLENHISGMRAISIMQRPDTLLPVIGKTLCIVQDEGLVTEKEQYVRVTDVSVELRVFTDERGDFERWVVTCSISDALRHNFTGHIPQRFDTLFTYVGKARIRDTTVADAARYFGAQPLTVAAAPGDLTINAASMFAQLVPSAQTETPLVNQLLAPELTVTISAGARDVEVAQQAHTRALPVTAENRRFNWIETLLPIPAPGELSVSYRAQGNWYQLTDDGFGAITGSDPSLGAGTISYTTGSLSVSLGALPDAGSQIMIVWGTPAHYVQRTVADVTLPAWVHQTAYLAIEPGTVTITWEVLGVTKTATDDGAGLLIGDGVGKINYTLGQLYLRPAELPEPGSTPQIEYDSGGVVVEDFTPTADGSGFISMTTSVPIEPGTLTAEWETVRTKTETERVTR